MLSVTIAVIVAGCASGPGGATSVSATPVAPNASGGSTSVSGSAGAASASPRLIQFALTVNDEGEFDSVNGYYAIAVNAFNQPIDVSNNETFSDFMVYDGVNTLWYHRQTIPSQSLFNFVPVALINQDVSFSDDRHTMLITFSLSDATSPLSQFVGTTFTADAFTTDRNGILGRVLDTMGPGPSLDNDTQYTYFCDKQLGVVNPVPNNFPNDRLNDWITQPDLGAAFPYVNFDIKRFEVTVR